MTAEHTLHVHDLELGDVVEVVVNDGTLLEGTVEDATTAVLVLTSKGRRRTRIPWHAITLIRTAIATHPATT